MRAWGLGLYNVVQGVIANTAVEHLMAQIWNFCPVQATRRKEEKSL